MTARDAKMTAPSVRLHARPTRIRLNRLMRLPTFLIALWCGLTFAMPATGFAQSARPALAVSAPARGSASAVPVKPIASRPVWAELTVQQQQALRPLAAGWDTISEAQKRKWLEISKNYPSLPPEGQATMHSRMVEWVGLSAQQRAQARLNFAKTKELSTQLTPDEKKAKWQTYQALSAEEKQNLAAKASPKPVGAATAVKPVAPQKLATFPTQPTQQGNTPAPKIITSSPVPGPGSVQGGGPASGADAAPSR